MICSGMKGRAVLPAFPEGRWKAFTLSYDDGNDCDVRLVEMMRKYGVKGTFNVNGGMLGKTPTEHGPKEWRRMTAEECVQCYGDDMEIAVHGFTHPFWKRMTTLSQMQDILDDKRTLEQMSGKIVRGAASPYGSWNKDTLEILRMAGFRYCRAAAGPGTENLDMYDGDPLEFTATAHHNNPRLFELADRFVNDISGHVKLFYVWGHSYEFVEKDNWDRMEQLLKTVGGRDDIWYATNLEIFDYWHALKQLQYSADQTMAYNPTSTDVWLRIHHMTRQDEAPLVKIPAGQTAEIRED